MSLRSGMLALLGLAVGLALVRHVVFLDRVITDPGGVMAAVEKHVSIFEWTVARARPEIASGRYQPVDLRSNSGLPFMAGKMAWQLPMPNSMQILARYRKNAKAKRLAFVVSPSERGQGIAMVRRICEELSIREAVLVVGAIGP